MFYVKVTSSFIQAETMTATPSRPTSASPHPATTAPRHHATTTSPRGGTTLENTYPTSDPRLVRVSVKSPSTHPPPPPAIDSQTIPPSHPSIRPLSAHEGASLLRLQGPDHGCEWLLSNYRILHPSVTTYIACAIETSNHFQFLLL